MSGVISRTVLDYMEEVATVVSAAILLSCFCCWWLWEGLELGLNCAHVCSDFYQLRHHCIVEAGKDCILLFQSIHIVPLVINSLCDCLQSLEWFKILFWWGGRSRTYIYILHCCGETPFPDAVTSRCCSLWDWWKNIECFPLLRLFDCQRHYLISLLKVVVCAKRVITFDTIMASEIVCPPDLTNEGPFYSWLTRQMRGYEGSDAPSSSYDFRRGQFCISSCRTWKYSITYIWPSPVQSLLNGTWLVGGISVVLLWRVAYLSPCLWKYSIGRVLGFSEHFDIDRFFLCGHHHRGVITCIVRRDKRMGRLVQIVLCSHR